MLTKFEFLNYFMIQRKNAERKFDKTKLKLIKH